MKPHLLEHLSALPGLLGGLWARPRTRRLLLLGNAALLGAALEGLHRTAPPSVFRGVLLLVVLVVGWSWFASERYQRRIRRQHDEASRTVAAAEEALLEGQLALLREMDSVSVSQLADVLHAKRGVDALGRPVVVLDLVCEPGEQVGFSPGGEVVYRELLQRPYETAVLVGPFGPAEDELLEDLTRSVVTSDGALTVSLSREYRRSPAGFLPAALTLSAPEWTVSQRYG